MEKYKAEERNGEWYIVEDKYVVCICYSKDRAIELCKELNEKYGS